MPKIKNRTKKIKEICKGFIFKTAGYCVVA
jgi:hypothetical protein